jgi:hypothetical protein
MKILESTKRQKSRVHEDIGEFEMKIRVSMVNLR